MKKKNLISKKFQKVPKKKVQKSSKKKKFQKVPKKKSSKKFQFQKVPKYIYSHNKRVLRTVLCSKNILWKLDQDLREFFQII